MNCENIPVNYSTDDFEEIGTFPKVTCIGFFRVQYLLCTIEGGYGLALNFVV